MYKSLLSDIAWMTRCYKGRLWLDSDTPCCEKDAHAAFSAPRRFLSLSTWHDTPLVQMSVMENAGVRLQVIINNHAGHSPW